MGVDEPTSDELKQHTMLCLSYFPLASESDLGVLGDVQKNRNYRVLRRLYEEGLVIREPMGRAGRVINRFWLSTQGAERTRVLEQLPARLIHGEAWLKRLAQRLQMVESFYPLGINLWEHPGVDTRAELYLTPDPNEEPTVFGPDVGIRGFHWIRRGDIHAVASYDNDGWVAFVWLGATLTAHDVEKKGARAVAELADGDFQPAGWVLVGADRLAAALGAELWPSTHVMAVTADGHVERRMSPAAFSYQRYVGPDALTELGEPGALGPWYRRDPAMQALHGRFRYQVYQYIADRRGITPEQLKKRFRDSCAGPLAKLAREQLITKREGGLYVMRVGGLAQAHMDGTSHSAIYKRLDRFVTGDGTYRRLQQRHDRNLVDVCQKLEQEDIPAFDGRRYLRDEPQVTQIRPDAAVLLDSRRGGSVIVALELEFRARGGKTMEGKLGPYRRSQQHTGKQAPSFWVFEDRAVEERYTRAGRGLLMFTTTLDDFMSRPSRSPDGPWRYQGRTVSIDAIVGMIDQAG